MLYKANCDQCSYEATFLTQLRSYEMPDGSTVTIYPTFVWCTACREIRWGEELPDLAELERRLASTRARDPEVVDFLVSSYGESRLDQELAHRTHNLELEIAWRRIRTSPPRCLECGSTAIIALERSIFRREGSKGGEWKWTLLQHPGCGGTIAVLTQPALVNTSGWFRYTPQGEPKQS